MRHAARASVHSVLSIAAPLLLSFCDVRENGEGQHGGHANRAGAGGGIEAGTANQGGRGGRAGDSGQASGESGAAGSDAGGAPEAGQGGVGANEPNPGGSGGEATEAGSPAKGDGGGGSDAGAGAGAGGESTNGGSGGEESDLGRCGAFEGRGTADAEDHALSLVLNASWQITQRSVGMAVDAVGRVYVVAGESIDVVEGNTKSTYLTFEEARATAGLASSDSGFTDMDIAPDGSLYILTRESILHSTAPHQATRWQVISRINQNLGVFGNAHVGVGTRDEGLWSFTSDGGEVLYAPAELGEGRNGCGIANFVIARSGVVLYKPSCNPLMIMRAVKSGAPAERVYESEPSGINPLNAEYFPCFTRDPQGGFYVMGMGPDGIRLFHLCEGATRFAGYNHIPTSPSFSEAATGLAFQFCSMAAAEDGTVFVQTYAELWKVTTSN